MAVHSLKKGKTVRQQVSKEEWEKRVDLAAAYRLTRRPFGVLEWPALLRKLDKIDTSYRE